MSQSKFALINNISLHLKQDGSSDGVPLVFINSLGSDLRIWDSVIPEFANHPIIRYDKRGHGLSDCPTPPYSIRNHTDDLAALFKTLQINKALLIGISVGGMIAMDFAATYPEQVKGLVLCDTFSKIGTTEMWNERINILREHGMAHLGDAILSRWFAPSFKDEHPSAYSGYFNMLTRMPVDGYTGTCEAIRDADLTEAARGIQQPTLVLCGAEDASTPQDLVSGLTNILPNTHYQEITEAGHLPCIENPQAMSAAIQDFLKDVI